MLMFLLGMLIMYLIVGVILVIEGFSSDWLQWLFGWWFVLPIMFCHWVKKKIKNFSKKC